MARSDLLLKLVRSASKGDRNLFNRTLEALVAEERKKQHHVLADQLAEFVRQNGSEPRPMLAARSEVDDLVLETVPSRPISSLVLPDSVYVPIQELLEEQQRRDLLRSHGLEPRNRVLLAGPPGNGKTSLAEAIAYELAVPLIVVRYDGVIGSFLGETAGRLRRVFEYARTRECVLFFDEFDTVGKERGDVHETGEIKRVVSSLLLHIDSVPSHVVVITATNHAELLDRAVWRRFQLRLSLPSPTRKAIEDWFQLFADRTDYDLGYAPRTLADKLLGLSFGELEEFSFAVLRQAILSEQPTRQVVRRQLRYIATRFTPNDAVEAE